MHRKPPTSQEIISMLQSYNLKLQPKQKHALKSRIFDNINVQEPELIKQLGQLKNSLEFAPHKKDLVKSIVGTTIRINQNPWVNLQQIYQSFFANLKPLSGFALLILLVASLILEPFSFSNQVFAAEKRYLQNIDSSVTINRINGEITSFKEATGQTFQIENNDILIFGPETNAELKILGGIVRPAANSKLKVIVNAEDTKIELIEGAAWFNIKKIDNEISTYVTAPGIKLAPQNSIFDVSVKDFTRVINIDQNLNGTLNDGKQIIPITIPPAQSLKFRPKTPATQYEQLAFSDLELTESEQARIKTNLNADINFEKYFNSELLEFAQAKVGSTPNEPIKYATKEIIRQTKLAFTLDPVKKAQAKTKIAEEKLIEAQILVYQNKIEPDKTAKLETKEQIEKLLVEAKTSITEINAAANNLQADAPSSTKLIKDELANALLTSKIVVDASSSAIEQTSTPDQQETLSELQEITNTIEIAAQIAQIDLQTTNIAPSSTDNELSIETNSIEPTSLVTPETRSDSITSTVDLSKQSSDTPVPVIDESTTDNIAITAKEEPSSTIEVTSGITTVPPQTTTTTPTITTQLQENGSTNLEEISNTSLQKIEIRLDPIDSSFLKN